MLIKVARRSRVADVAETTRKGLLEGLCAAELLALYRTARLWSTLRPDLPEASALVAQVERRLGFSPPGGGPLN